MDFADIRIPPGHAEIFKAVHVEIACLSALWKTYRQLFESPEVVRLLNEACSSAFRVFQMTLHDSIVLKVTRLTDPKKSGDKDHLTLHRLRDMAMAANERAPTPELIELIRGSKKLLREIETSAFALRTHRSSSIAHADLDVVLGKVSVVTYSHEDMREVIEKIWHLMNRFESEFLGTVVAYSGNFLASDGSELVHLLAHGLRMQELQNASWREAADATSLLAELRRVVHVPQVRD